MPPFGRGLDAIGHRGGKIARGATPVITPPSGGDPSGLQGTFGVVLGDGSSNKPDFLIANNHINARRTALLGAAAGKHHLKSCRVDMQWTGWESSQGNRSSGQLRLDLIQAIGDAGMVPFLGTWFVPNWAQRQDIIGMSSMDGTVTAEIQTDKGLRSQITMDVTIPKGFYKDILLNGPGIPSPGITIESSSGRVFTLSNANANVGQSGTYRVGGVNSPGENSRLPLDPSHYVHAFESFKWLGQQLAGFDFPIVFELSNEGNHVPFSRPRAYPEMFARWQMYMWAGMIEGSGANYDKRYMCPCSCAHILDGAPSGGKPPDTSVFRYPDLTTGPNWLEPVHYYQRWIDEMERQIPNWQTLRASTPSGTDISSKTASHSYCNAYSTHAYTQYRFSPFTSGVDNMIHPGSAAATSFNNDGPNIHNYGYNKGGSIGAQLRKWLVHYTENGPGWGEVNDNNGYLATIGVGFTGTDPAMVAEGPGEAKQILHPHEAFNYIMFAWYYMTGQAPWPGVAWDCGEVMIGSYCMFRGDGSVTDTPLHQTLSCFFKHGSNPPVVRGEITRTSGARSGVCDMAPFKSYLGYSPVDALAVLD